MNFLTAWKARKAVISEKKMDNFDLTVGVALINLKQSLSSIEWGLMEFQ